MSFETIKTELKRHLTDMVENGDINEDNFEEAHFHAFNEDYYVVGYARAEQWLATHNVSAFAAIQKCTEYENEHFGQVSKDYDNAESTVNMLVYVLGHDVVPYADTWEEFKEELGG